MFFPNLSFFIHFFPSVFKHIKFTILTIFKCVVQCYVSMLCNHHHHLSPDLFSSYRTETILNKQNASFPLPQPLATMLFLCASMSLIIHVSGIIQHLSFCDWLISLGTMSSRFTEVKGYVRISFLLRLNNIPDM